MSEEEFTVERWINAGRRFWPDSGKLVDAWRDPSGKELHYDKLNGSPGGEYDIKVSRGEGTRVSGTPVFRQMHTDRDQVMAWQVQDRKAQDELARHRLEKNAKRMSELDEAMEPILAIARRLRSTSDRAALANYIAAKIHRVN